MGCLLGSLWGSFSTLFVKTFIFLGKVATLDFERQYSVLRVFSWSGPPGKQENEKKRFGKIIVFFTCETRVPGSVFFSFGVHLGSILKPGGTPKC